MSLPFELVDYICQHLSNHELASVATSSSNLCAIAQRILFEDLRLYGQYLGILITLASKPHLAQHVRSLRVFAGGHHEDHSVHCEALSSALDHMSELEFLSLSFPTHHNSTAILPEKPRIVYERLRTLNVSFSPDTRFVRFLGQIPGLVHLGVDHHPWTHPQPFNVPLNCIPKLNTFRGSLHDALAIVPKRPVHSIFLISGDLTVDAIPTLALSSTPIAILDAATTSAPLPILRSLASEMPQLFQVRINTTWDLWDTQCNAVSELAFVPSIAPFGFRADATTVRHSRPKSKIFLELCPVLSLPIYPAFAGGGVRRARTWSLLNPLPRYHIHTTATIVLNRG